LGFPLITAPKLQLWNVTLPFEILTNLKKILPIEGQQLNVLLDVNLRNSIAHGTFWFDGTSVFLAENSYLANDDVEKLDLIDFWKRIRRINLISHAFIERLVNKAEAGYFIQDSL